MHPADVNFHVAGPFPAPANNNDVLTDRLAIIL